MFYAHIVHPYLDLKTRMTTIIIITKMIIAASKGPPITAPSNIAPTNKERKCKQYTQYNPLDARGAFIVLCIYIGSTQ